MRPVLFHFGSIFIPAYGALAACGVLLALVVAQRIARTAHIDPNRIWSLCIVALFTALITARILLVIFNWSSLRSHPAWVLGLAMIHHPALAAVGGLLAVIAAWIYARWQQMPVRATADALAAPLVLGLAFEQAGALLAGSGYGTGTHVPWAVVYTNPLAARWSGAPIGIPVHPVQAYAALAFLAIFMTLMLWFPYRAQHGDVAGLCLMATGIGLYVTEFWRDPIGRGAMLDGFLRGPQAAAILLVLTGTLLLLERTSERIDRTIPPVREPALHESAPKESHG